MMTIHQMLRKRLLDRAGLTEHLIPNLETDDISRLYETEWSTDFEMKMRNRLVMGALRYGKIDRTDPNGFDLVGSAISKLQAYLKDPNSEKLVDAANYCLLESVLGDNYFASTDDTDHAKTK